MLHLAEKTSAGFEATFGYAPTGVWQSPGRVNLIGEHTDYNQGFVLPLAINYATYAAISLREDSLVRVGSTFASEVIETEVARLADAKGWSAYPLGVGHVLGGRSGFDIFIDSDVPVGAGLSSSAAIECAVALGLSELWDMSLTPSELARLCQRAENEVVGAPTGIMDQTASLFGKADHAVFIDCQSLDTKTIELGFDAAGVELLIIDTKVAHRLVDGGYAERRAACETGAAAMGVASLRELKSADLPKAKDLVDDVTFRRLRHVITENERVLRVIENLGNLEAVGRLMYESHESMRDDFEISVDELDAAVETALRHGAIGSRMTGGGFGGAAIALTPVGKISAVTNSIYAEFENIGFARPNIFAVAASNGGSRVI